MNWTQAAAIAQHLHDAADAVDRASEVISTLGQEERATLAVPLGEIVSALHFELLRRVYERHPDLRPPSVDVPVIYSDLQWKDVALPASLSETDLDQLIFSVLTSRWQKTSVVVGEAFARCNELGLPISVEMLGARIRALADARRLEGAGELRAWRHSEVRLTD